MSPVSIEYFGSENKPGRVDNIAPGEVYVVVSSDGKSSQYYLINCEPADDGAVVYLAQSTADFTNHDNTLKLINPEQVKTFFRVGADTAENLVVRNWAGVILGKLVIKHASP